MKLILSALILTIAYGLSISPTAKVQDHPVNLPTINQLKLQFVTKRLGKRIELARTFMAATAGTDIDALVLAGIYFVESTNGKFDSCQQFGQKNGFGYGIYKGSHICFATTEEAASAVVHLLNNDPRYQGQTLKEKLCKYNTGRKMDTCPYAEKVLNYAYE